MIKMFVTDIDGTLVKYDCTYSKRTYDTINKLSDMGVKVVLASGRMFDGVYPIAKAFNLETPVICYQGAMVRDKNRVLWQSSLNHDIASQIIDVLREKNVHVNLYNDDVLYVEDDDKKIMGDYCNGRFVDYKVVKSFDDIKFGNISKLLAAIYDEKKLLDIRDEMSERFKGKISVVRSHKYYCEFTDINATKGHALDFLRDYWGFNHNEVMGAGDNDNDIDLLLHSGVKIAMENGSESLKKVADFICPRVDDDGLCDAIERFILCE